MTCELQTGDVNALLKQLPDCSVQCVVTSPPYWGLRDYGVEGQIGLEATPDAYVESLVTVFTEVRRVLKDNGVCWLNLGDSYARNGGNVESRMATIENMNVGQKATYLAGGMMTVDRVPEGSKVKELIGIPWRVAFALQKSGWYLRQDIIWHKPNPMPEAVTDRCTKAHEYVFLMTKNANYYFNQISEDSVNGAGRNSRSVWSVNVATFSGAHFATFPKELIRPMILAGSAPGDLVLDPFSGAATTGVVCIEESRNYIGLELNPAYNEMARQRLDATPPPLTEAQVTEQQRLLIEERESNARIAEAKRVLKDYRESRRKK